MPFAFLLIKKIITIKIIENFLTVFLISLVILLLILGFFIVNFFELYSLKLIILAVENWKFKHILLNVFYKDFHPTYISMAFLLGNFILFSRIREGKNTMKNLLYFVTIILFSLAILILRSRIIVISFVVITPIFLLLTYNILNYRKLFYTTIIGAFLLIISVNFLSQSQIVDLKKQFNNSLRIDNKNISRIEIYSSCYDVIKKNFFFGVGVGDVKKELIDSYKNKGLHQLYENKFFNSHNQYLDYLLSGGVFSLLLLIGSFIFLLSICLRTSDHLFFCFLLMIMLVMLTENIFSRINGIFFFSLFSSILFYKNRMISKNLHEK
jgi:O-antigen ligase